MRKIIVSIIVFLAFFGSTMNIEASSGFGWGYKKNSDNQIPEVGKYHEMLEKYGAYYADFSGEKNIYLTFDKDRKSVV